MDREQWLNFENCVRRSFRDFHQEIPFHSISRLSRTASKILLEVILWKIDPISGFFGSHIGVIRIIWN